MVRALGVGRDYNKAVENAKKPCGHKPRDNTLKVLYVTTKPPWPAVDGGRLLVCHTLEGLAAAGHEVTLVAPSLGQETDDIAEALGRWCRPVLVPARPRPLPSALVFAQLRGQALSITRHALVPVRHAVEKLLQEEAFDVVHVEQIQALAQAQNARIPVVLREQNVESDLWRLTGNAEPGLKGLLARREAGRMARAERAAVARCSTIALTQDDAQRLQELAGSKYDVTVVRAPFPSVLPPGNRSLEGDPPIVQMGSEGWLPNRDAIEWFCGSIWPEVHAALPGTQLHVFGHTARKEIDGVSLNAVHWHPPPEESSTAFARGSIQVVPLRIGSGVRMKILEAWARRIPVVGTPTAVAGLEAEHDRDLLVAEDAAGFVEAFRRLREEDNLRDQLVEGGRRSLVERHDPEKIVADLCKVYENAIRRQP